MRQQKRNRSGSKGLRTRAEEARRKKPGDLEDTPPDDVRKLVHDLEVHQVELEMQNEELRRIQTELTESKNKYSDLYDFAPVGYLTLDENGVILEANLAASDLLGVERRYLLKQGFSNFVSPDSQEVFYSHRKELLSSRTKQICDLRLVKKDGNPIDAQLESILAQNIEGLPSRLRTTITDITKLRQAELAFRETARFNELLLDTLPHPAMLIRKDRVILAANRIAREAGANVGGLCWKKFGRGEYISDHHKQYLAEHPGSLPPGGTKCTFCLADEVFEGHEAQNNPEVKALGQLWDTWWIPIDDDRYLHYAVNITERKKMENVLAKRLEFEKLISDISTRFINLSPESIDCGIEQALKEIGEFANVDGGYVFLFSEDMGKMSMTHLWRNRNLSTRKRDMQALDAGSMPWWVGKLKNHEPVVVPSVADLPPEAALERSIIESQGIQTLVDVPMVSLGKPIGFLGFSCAMQRRDWADEEISLLKMVGQMITNALQRKETDASLKKANDELERRVVERTAELRKLSSQLLDAHEEERRHIALDLHDGLGQNLSAIKFRVEGILQGLEGEMGGSCARALGAIVPVVQEAVDEVRRMQRNLRPSVLDDLGILATISWFCREFERTHTGTHIEKQIDIREVEVPESLKIVIYRIIQEAFNNIAKHSHAHLARLIFTGTDGKIELTVEDEGEGFDVAQALSGEPSLKGLGLTGMKERTELAGGSFSIESNKGKGTTIYAFWKC